MTLTRTDAPPGAWFGGGTLRRRKFLRGAGAMGVGAAALAASGPEALGQVAGVNDPNILNFALNLEYLEAEFYTYALTGMGIQAAGIPVTGLNTGAGNPGRVVITANPKVPFVTPAIQQYAAELAIDEQKHVVDIRNLLIAFGYPPVAKPTLDLLNSFNALAMLAGLPTPFDPFANELNFLLGSYIFEDVGVSAYTGAAPLLTNRNVISYASGIQAIEGYHSGLIRTNLNELNQGAATQAISNARLSLGGGTDYGVGTPTATGTSVILSDSQGRSSSRTTRQVLNIVYGRVNATMGGFFPLGLNGAIRS